MTPHGRSAWAPLILALALTLTPSCKRSAPAGGDVRPERSAAAAGASLAGSPSLASAREVRPALVPNIPRSIPTDEAPSIPAPPDVAAPPADAEKTASGLATKVLQAGKGEARDRPRPQDHVKVHYTGWTTDGRMFDSSITRGQPSSFGVTQVIPGWTEGLQLMVPGEKRRLWIPAALAYGETPTRPGAPAGALTFDVELLEVARAPEAPKDVAKPPATAKKTASGLRWQLLSAGKGTRRPSATDRVKVHYSGWTPDGKLFDSSVVRGSPTTFRLDQVIKGWTEGLQLAREGDKLRLWIPADLAYGEKPQRPGAPAGPLVFDVELLEIVPSPLEGRR